MVIFEAIDTSLKTAQRIIMVACAAFIVCAVGTGAILRYLFGMDLYGAEEFITIAAFWLYFAGAVYATHTHRHISAEIVSTYVHNARTRLIIHLFRGVVTVGLALLYSVWAWDFFYWSMTDGGWTTVWQIPLVVAHTAVFVGFVLMAWYFLVDLVGDVNNLLRRRIRVESQYARAHPTTQALNTFKERVEEATSGRVRLGHPNYEIGGYTRAYEELQLGTIGMALISVPSQLDPRLEIIYLPYLATSYDEARRVYARGSTLFNEVEQLHTALGVKFLGFNFEGFGGIALKRLPDKLEHPDQAKNLVVRVPPMDVFKQAAEDQGFETVIVPYRELSLTLDTNEVDGSTGDPPAAIYLQFRKFFKHYVVNHGFFESSSYLMSKEIWNSFSTEDQRIIEDIVAELSQQSFDRAEADDRKYLAKLREAGIDVITFTEQQLAAWAAHTHRTTWPKLGERLGNDLIARLTADYAGDKTGGQKP
jgi:TRAP-type C4-dicarboxylate transport system substrate-binding protein